MTTSITPLPLNPERPEPRNRRESLASIAQILLESMTPETLLSLASDRDVPPWGQALAAEMAETTDMLSARLVSGSAAAVFGQQP